MKPPEPKPISITHWDTGISESPYRGFAEMRNLDVTVHPGAVVLNPSLLPTISTAVSGTFTADASTDILTGPNLAYTNGTQGVVGYRAVTVSSSGTLPAPLAAATTYFIVQVSSTTYKLATTLTNAVAGTTIDITTAGTGTHTLTSIDPTVFNHFAKDEGNNKLYGVDANCRVWQMQAGGQWALITGNTLTSGSGNGLAIAFDYLFAFRNGNVDVCGPLTANPTPGTAQWSNSWQSLKGGTGKHYSLMGQDNILYWGDDDGSFNPFIGSLQQTAAMTFDPATAGTYTFNTGALGLPKYKIVTRLAELGQNLMIASNSREIYPWDRFSATFALPIICGETGIYCIHTVNNQLIIAAGVKGNLYAYNGSQAQPLKIFPKHLLLNDSSQATVGAMAVVGRKLLYTVQTATNSGVYSLDLVTNVMVMENSVSGGVFGTLNPMTLPALYSDGQTYWVGWKDSDSGTAGVDESTENGTPRFTTSTAYLVTPNLDIGYYNIPRILQYVETYTDRPMLTGQTIVIKYRTSLAASWTTLATITGAGTDKVYQTNAGSISDTDVQFRLDINNANATAGPYLQEFRIMPSL